MSDAWSAGTWTHPPADTRTDGKDLLVTAAGGSDAWRLTSYGFVRDSAHALLAPLAPGNAVEVAFTAALPEQFDQAGIMLRVDERNWVKAGLERSDGHLQLGAVVTRDYSDWSLARADEWADARVRIRLSRTADALVVRAARGAEPWRLVRVAPLLDSLDAQAGPYLAAPSRAGLTVRFHDWATNEADASLH